FSFGPEYIIPKPFDPRVLLKVAPAVAEAAVRSGVAQVPLEVRSYTAKLRKHLGRRHEVMQLIRGKAQTDPRRIACPEGAEPKILRAAQGCIEEGLAHPILLGPVDIIRARARAIGVNVDAMELIDPIGPEEAERRAAYAERLWQRRCRKGLTRDWA